MRIIGSSSSGGSKPTTPTIGAATDGGTGTTASVAFTPSTYIGKGTITYTATSSPGGLTGTGSSSPITVSGLTTGTAYTFTVLGTTNYGIASDSSTASNSVTPVTPSSFESIATANPSGPNAVTFSSIPSTYKHLQIRFRYKDTSTTDYGPVSAFVYFTFNNDTGGNYDRHNLRGVNGSVIASAGTNAGSIALYGSYLSSNATYANMFGVGIVDITDYASTSKNKTVRAFIGNDSNGNAPANRAVSLTSGLWRSTSAVNRIDLYPGVDGFATGTTFELYGIKG